jgi:hypothetical protein
MRCLAICVVLMLPSLALPCVKRPREDWSKVSPSGAWRADVGGRLRLSQKGVPKWSVRGGPDVIEFSADEKWLAALDGDTLTLYEVATGRAAAVADPRSVLTEDERSRFTQSSCGVMWFAGLKLERDGAHVFITQRGQLPPIYEGPKDLEVIVSYEGQLTRPKARTP